MAAALLDHEILRDEFTAIIENYEKSKYNLPPAGLGIELGPGETSEHKTDPETDSEADKNPVVEA